MSLLAWNLCFCPLTGCLLFHLARPYTRCQWLITPGYAPIVLSFSTFSLAANDTVSVYDGELADPARLLAVYSGLATCAWV